MSTKVQLRPIVEEMEESYLDYSMSVIVQRALPDVRDGLKPVHRRILYAMYDIGLRPSSPLRKSATVVGEVLGKYHPHGDVAIYDSLVHLAQDFKMRYPLITPQGNFGSMDGDRAAAMRYTETKLAPLSLALLTDIEKDTVDFMPNFDGSRKEPKVLPAKLPSLLINGTMGIAVGMATNIPPHNLAEVCDAVTLLIDSPEAGIENLMKCIKGPDFPTGGTLYGVEDIKQAYATGRGGITYRGKAEIVESKEDKFQILITEMPYQVNKAVLVQKIAGLVKDKKIIGIKNIRDESSKQGIRIVIDLKKDASPNKILNKLYQVTDLQTKFHVNMIALSRGIQPNLLTLKQILEEYIKHRQVVVKRRTEFDLARARARAHILAGLKIALIHLDEIIKTFKRSPTKEKARVNLIKKFKLTQIQADAICEMRLEQLAGLERKKIEDEYKEKLKLIKELEKILGDSKEISNLIKEELVLLKNKYADQRRTKIYRNPVEEIGKEDIVEDVPCIIILTQGGYIKRMPITSYKIQGRGGKGVIGNRLKEEDIICQILACTTCSRILFFTDRGRVFQLKAYEIPEAGRTARGEALVNFLQIEPDEKVTTLVNLEVTESSQYVFMTTGLGVVKKTRVQDFQKVRRSGLIAIKLEKDDLLRWVEVTSGKDEIFLITKNGKCIRFKEKDVRSMGRSARGVRGINLGRDDEVCGMDVIRKLKTQNSRRRPSGFGASATKLKTSKDRMLLVISENGYGKKSNLKEYHVQHRGGKGINTTKITKKTGKLIAGCILNPEDRDLIVVSKQAQIIRLSLAQIPTLRRATQGVRVMRLNENDKAASTTVL